MTAEAAFTGVDATISIASNRRGHCDGCDSQGEAHCRLRKVVLGSAMNVTLSADSHAGNGLRHKVMCHAVSMTEKTTLKFEYNYADVEPLCPVETQKVYRMPIIGFRGIIGVTTSLHVHVDGQTCKPFSKGRKWLNVLVEMRHETQAHHKYYMGGLFHMERRIC
jgi:hypothetical protein